MPTVSIITPCYNQGEYLGAATDSVFAQSYIDYEHIIVDDGSTDNTAEVAASYNDPRLHYHYQPNAGLAAARNAGIRLATGDLLAFLDSDDQWEPNFLETCISVLRSQHEMVAGVYSGHRLIDQKGNYLPKTYTPAVPPTELRTRLLRAGFFPPCTVLIRTDIVRKLNGFDEYLDGRGTEDWDLWLRITQKYHMVSIPQALARYRVYPSSMSNDPEGMHRSRISVLEKHFGPLGDDAAKWTEIQRAAFGSAYRAAAFDYLVNGDRESAWRQLKLAGQLKPAIWLEPSTYFELACDNQPRTYRGDVLRVDLPSVADEIYSRLTDYLDEAQSSGSPSRVAILGRFFLTLAGIAEQAGHRSLASRYLVRALKAQPSLLRTRVVRRQIAKIALGSSIPRWVKTRRDTWFPSQSLSRSTNINQA